MALDAKTLGKILFHNSVHMCVYMFVYVCLCVCVHKKQEFYEIIPLLCTKRYGDFRLIFEMLISTHEIDISMGCDLCLKTTVGGHLLSQSTSLVSE